MSRMMEKDVKYRVTALKISGLFQPNRLIIRSFIVNEDFPATAISLLKEDHIAGFFVLFSLTLRITTRIKTAACPDCPFRFSRSAKIRLDSPCCNIP
jgi:hypothetical protein